MHSSILCVWLVCELALSVLRHNSWMIKARILRTHWLNQWLNQWLNIWRVLTCVALLAAAPAQATPANDAKLIEAASRGDAPAVRALLRAGASTAARDAEGRTALVAATYANAVDAARALIEAGADVNAQDKLKNSAYLLAGARGHLEILKLTLPKADFKSLNRYGGTALIPACHYGHVDTVRELLKWPVDINHVNNLGWTALLETAILGDGSAKYVEIARMLLAAGAKPNVADRQGITPLMHAKQRGHAALAEVLARGGGS
jgi:uncharacterized protein